MLISELKFFKDPAWLSELTQSESARAITQELYFPICSLELKKYGSNRTSCKATKLKALRPLAGTLPTDLPNFNSRLGMLISELKLSKASPGYLSAPSPEALKPSRRNFTSRSAAWSSGSTVPTVLQRKPSS